MPTVNLSFSKLNLHNLVHAVFFSAYKLLKLAM